MLNNIFAKDKKHVYCADGIAKRCDPKTFEVLDEGKTNFCGGKCGYARDATNVYFHDSAEGNAKLIRGANRDEFRVIRGGFATDGKRVYIFRRRILKVDFATFKPLGKNYSKDANRAYYLNFEVDDADVASFRATSAAKAADKNRTYRRYYEERT